MIQCVNIDEQASHWYIKARSLYERIGFVIRRDAINYKRLEREDCSIQSTNASLLQSLFFDFNMLFNIICF